MNGGVIAFLCGGGGKPVCPRNGTVTGNIVAADVVGPGRGIDPGEFGELIKAMRNGASYANVHTNTYQPGETGKHQVATEPHSPLSRQAGRPARVARLFAFFAAQRT